MLMTNYLLSIASVLVETSSNEVSGVESSRTECHAAPTVAWALNDFVVDFGFGLGFLPTPVRRPA